MGTNFYLHERAAKKPCPTCGHLENPSARLHIGKSSAGWAFGLHVYPDGILDSGDAALNLAVLPVDLDGWRRLWEDGETYKILTEYGDEVAPEEMLKRITERSHPRGLRHHPTGDHLCMGPAPDGGTYDLMTGYFS
jgi:hypothetical protein